ncbi:MAG: mandelate racemase/muconate lactonizing enzyme family protein [Bryobacteraceae bacterium]
MTDRRSILTMFPAAAAFAAFRHDARAQGTSRAPRLKITAVKAVRLKGINSRFVRVYTDQGLAGTGETLDTIGAEDLINNHLGPAIVGRDPLDVEKIWYDFWSWPSPPGGIPPVFMRGMGGPYLSAMSGIDIALWDLAGKALGVPIYRLFGGKLRDRIAVYFHAYDPKQAAEAVRTTGVKALKAVRLDSGTEEENPSKGYDPGKKYNWTLSNPEIDAFAARVGALREAVGPAIGIGLECHARYDTESAIQLAKAVEPYRVMWLEEPVPSDNPESMAAVRAATRIPIACGENVYTRYGFRPFLEKQAVSVIQLDMAKCGGLLESRKIASMAEVYNIPIAPHGMASPLGQTAFAHICATVPNFMLLEWGQYFNQNVTRLAGMPKYSAGFLELPETPGIGVDINESVVKELLLPGYTL